MTQFLVTQKIPRVTSRQVCSPRKYKWHKKYSIVNMYEEKALHNYFMTCHRNIVVSTINATHTQRTVRRLLEIASNKQRLHIFRLVVFFYDMVNELDKKVKHFHLLQNKTTGDGAYSWCQDSGPNHTHNRAPEEREKGYECLRDHLTQSLHKATTPRFSIWGALVRY